MLVSLHVCPWKSKAQNQIIKTLLRIYYGGGLTFRFRFPAIQLGLLTRSFVHLYWQGIQPYLFAIGGGSLFAIHSECEVYNPRTDRWSFIASMNTRQGIIDGFSKIGTLSFELSRSIESSLRSKEDLNRKLDFSVILLIQTTSAGMKLWHAN